jgi:hypothetical protein
MSFGLIEDDVTLVVGIHIHRSNALGSGETRNAQRQASDS